MTTLRALPLAAALTIAACSTPPEPATPEDPAPEAPATVEDLAPAPEDAVPPSTPAPEPAPEHPGLEDDAAWDVARGPRRAALARAALAETALTPSEAVAKAMARAGGAQLVEVELDAEASPARVYLELIDGGTLTLLSADLDSGAVREEGSERAEAEAVALLTAIAKLEGALALDALLTHDDGTVIGAELVSYDDAPAYKLELLADDGLHHHWLNPGGGDELHRAEESWLPVVELTEPPPETPPADEG